MYAMLCQYEICLCSCRYSCVYAMLQESLLPLDASCNPVHAWAYNRANTIFQVYHLLVKTPDNSPPLGHFAKECSRRIQALLES